MNFLHLAGNLGADPEVRFTSGGAKVTTLRVACKARKKGGEDKTIWWRVTVWGDQYDKMISHLKKGSSLMVVGEMEEPHIYNDRDGKPQVSMSMTASHLMFSPFGRTDQKQDHQAPQSLRADSTVSSLESAFDHANTTPGFSSGQGMYGGYSMENNSYPNDEEIPF